MALARGQHADIMERPKVLYNHMTRKFVMWVHIDDGQYSWARVGVAVSNTPVGPFKVLRSFRPHEQESRDMTVWKVQARSYRYLNMSVNVNRTHALKNVLTPIAGFNMLT